MGNFISTLLALARQLGPKLEEAWPYIKHAYDDMMKVYEIYNGGPLRMEGPLTVKTPQGIELAKELRRFGASEDEIVETVAKAELLDDRFPKVGM